MIVILAVLGVIILCVMVYLALSKKTSFWLRIAALIALGLMILAVIISLIFIFFGGASVTNVQVITDVETPPVQAQPAGNNLLNFIFILVLIGFFALIMILSLRETRRKKPV